MGGKDIPVREEGEKRGVSFGDSFTYSVVLEADIEAGRGAGPERLLNVNPCTICRLRVLSKWHYLSEPLLSACRILLQDFFYVNEAK